MAKRCSNSNGSPDVRIYRGDTYIPRVGAWRVTTVMLLAFASVFNVAAQLTEVTCPDSLSWMENSKGQNPCLVAAYLDGVCHSEPVDWITHALTNGQCYAPPAKADGSATDCKCNTVVYSLLSACAYCQPDTSNLQWSVWISNCSASFVAEYPRLIPEGTDVPEWAYLDVTFIDRWDENAASSFAVSGSTSTAVSTPSESTSTSTPETTSLPSSTVSSFTFTSTTGPTPDGSVTSLTAVSSTSTPPSSNVASSFGADSVLTPTPSTIVRSTAKSKNVGAIIGGVLGAVLGGAALLAIIVLSVVVCNRYYRTPQQPTFTTYGGSPLEYPTNRRETLISLGSFEAGPTLVKARAYDPDSPLTFPPASQTTFRHFGGYDGYPEV